MIRFGTLTSSSTKIVLDAENGMKILSMKTFHLKFLRLAQSQNMISNKLRCSSINASEVNVEAEEFEPIDKLAASRESVRVRFQLRKECVFGEHFFILGDNPLFGGLWDPDNALPLTWSDGHLWSVELDLPVGRLIEFKFIRKAITGEILWQPGPNRAIETWQTNKTIRVCEDWENAALQMLVEEHASPIFQEEEQSCLVNLDMPIVAENITPQQQSVRKPIAADVSSNGSEDGLGNVNNSPALVVEDAGYINTESDESSDSDIQSEESIEPLNGAVTARGVWEGNVSKEAMYTEEEEGPVLVPGLIPISDVDGHIPHVSEEAISEGKTERFPEVCKKEETEVERNEKQKVKVISSEGEAKSVETMYHSEAEEEMQQQQQTDSLGTPSVVFEKDIQWGRRTLHKLLSNFGLL